MRRETTEGEERKEGHQLAGLQGGRGDGNDGGEQRRVERVGQGVGEETGVGERITSSSTKLGKSQGRGCA